MYSRRAWGGAVDPYILAKFIKPEGGNEPTADPIVSLVIFEWRDVDLIGIIPPDSNIVQHTLPPILGLR